MLQIACPHCGPRDENEFSCGGEAHIVRPTQPETISDAEWAERWCHTLGCRRWFNVERDTVTHAILRVYAMGTPRGSGSA